MNVGNKLRQNVTSMVESAREGMGFKPDELALAQQIINGTRAQNALRGVSNALGGGGGIGMWAPVLGAAGLGGAYASGNPELAGAVALPALGLGARVAYNRSVANQAKQLGQMIAARSALGQARPAVPPDPALLRALLAAQASQRSRTPETYRFSQQ